MAESVDYIKQVTLLLESGKFKEALNLANEERYKNLLNNHCGDLITLFVEKIQDDTITIKPSLYGVCEEMLSQIICKCPPEETLLEFIERIEVAQNDAQFGIILTPLRQLLGKLTSKRVRTLEWCFNAISNYIENIPIPEYQLEGDERKLMDSDPNIRRVTRVYSMLPSFYQQFISEYLAALNPDVKTKEIITAFLISLLGKPMIYIDVDPNSNEKSEARQICYIIIQDICKLERNVQYFLQFIDICLKEHKKMPSDSDEEVRVYDNRDKINLKTLSGLFYCVYSGHFEFGLSVIPQVYSNEYINHNMIFLVNHLLTYAEYGPLAKALSLVEAINNRLPSNTSHTLLSSSVHFDLCKHLVNVAVYSNFQTVRKNAVNLIGTHLSKFDFKGRYMLIKYIMDTSNHSGMNGFVIGQYKDALNQSLNKPILDEYYKGAKLMGMIKKMCHLPHGAESDLMELADQIIAALNFLRFVIIKDTNNATGIKDMCSFIETEYLEVLRTALKISKAHYELKLKDLQEGKKLTEEDTKVTLSVGGNVLDTMPTNNKIQVIESALNGFHLIECLVARLSEIINV